MVQTLHGESSAPVDLLSAASVLHGTAPSRTEPTTGRRDCATCRGCGIVGVSARTSESCDSAECPDCDGSGIEGGMARGTDGGAAKFALSFFGVELV